MSVSLEMGSRQSLKSKKMFVEKVHFTSFRGYVLNFPTVFGLAVAWFEAKPPTWVCFDNCKSKKSGKIQIIAFKIQLSIDFCFWTSNFDDSPFSNQLTYKETDIYLKRKLYLVVNEWAFEIARISTRRP